MYVIIFAVFPLIGIQVILYTIWFGLFVLIAYVGYSLSKVSPEKNCSDNISPIAREIRGSISFLSVLVRK